jgi:hypothetical protein
MLFGYQAAHAVTTPSEIVFGVLKKVLRGDGGCRPGRDLSSRQTQNVAKDMEIGQPNVTAPHLDSADTGRRLCCAPIAVTTDRRMAWGTPVGRERPAPTVRRPCNPRRTAAPTSALNRQPHVSSDRDCLSQERRHARKGCCDGQLRLDAAESMGSRRRWDLHRKIIFRRGRSVAWRRNGTIA